jgi:sugar-specific transcriptional regulator TrmB
LSSISDLGSTLVKFGITNQEADLFLILTRIKKGGAEWTTGSDVAKSVGKDRIRTYQLLQRLLKLGLVQSSYSSRPKMYSAVEPSVAVRHLMSIHEAKLTQLSHIEHKVTEALLNVSPLEVQLSRQDSQEAFDVMSSNVILVHGLPNIQILLKKMMSGQKKVYLVANDESHNHVFATLGIIAPPPYQIKIIISSSKGRKHLPRSIVGRLNCEVVNTPIRLPTIILTPNQYVLLFYSFAKYKKSVLSAVNVRPRVSDCLLVKHKNSIEQMQQMYQVCWQAATNTNQW